MERWGVGGWVGGRGAGGALIYSAGAATDPVLTRVVCLHVFMFRSLSPRPPHPQAFKFPSWEAFEAALLNPAAYAQISGILNSQGLGSFLALTPFHTLSLLENVIDGWDTPNHLMERVFLLKLFQVGWGGGWGAPFPAAGCCPR